MHDCHQSRLFATLLAEIRPLRSEFLTDPAAPGRPGTVMNLVNIDSVKLSCKSCSLAELCLPRRLSPEDLVKFEEIVTQKSPIPKGGTLYRSGQPAHALYAIKSGALKSVVTTEDGEEQIVGFHMPGELV